MSSKYVYEYRPVTAEDTERFNSYKSEIKSEILEKFSSISSDFDPVPVLYRNLPACGQIENFKVALPDNKYVKISIISPGHQLYDADGKPIKSKTSVSVDDELTSTPDD